jgi:ATP-binding cassette subfamily B protein
MNTNDDPDRRPAGDRFDQLKRLMGFLAPYRRRVSAAIVALVVAAASTLAIGQGLRLVVDRGFAATDPALLDRMLLLTLAIIAVMAVASAVRFYLVSWLGERVAADLRARVYSHLLSLEPAFFERNGVGEIQSRVTTDTTLLQSILGSSFSLAVRNSLLLVGALAMMLVTSPRLSAMVLLGMPLVIVPVLFFGRRVRRLSRSSQDRVADVSAYAGESLNAITTVQAFNHEPTDRLRFHERVEGAFDTAARRIQERALLTGMAMLLVFTAVGIILWQGGHDVLAGRMSAGQLSAFVFYAVLAAGAVGAVAEVTGDVMRAAGAAERLLELLDTTPGITAPTPARHLPEPPRGALTIEGVTFSYPTRPDIPAVADLNLDIQTGERLALVGPSGAGKSTLLALLLRFYDPDHGCIRFDGVDIRGVDPRALRARIGLVAQEPTLFSADARENIRYARPDASDGAVRRAAEAAQCLDFIDTMPKGLATPLGPGGVQLSGGQRQRIAIARALLADPPVLLLDEATSNLDADNERRIQAALEAVMRERTSLVIAHRLATVRGADRIAVMEDGRITATGPHDELLERSPLYAHLAALQFAQPDTGIARYPA